MCRGLDRLWKKGQKQAMEWGDISKAEYEARLKAGPPDRYFISLNRIITQEKTKLTDEEREKLK